MKKRVVLYYSKNGSNKFLANKISEKLKCEIFPIEPRLNSFGSLVFSTLLNFSFGVKNLNIELEKYDEVILCSPIWMGKIISPTNGFIKKNIKSIKRLIFVTCCGSSDEKKDDKFGYAGVFNNLKIKLDGKLQGCIAFPVGLIAPKDIKNEPEEMMKIRLNEDTFSGEIILRLDTFLRDIS